MFTKDIPRDQKDPDWFWVYSSIPDFCIKSVKHAANIVYVFVICGGVGIK